MIIYSQGLFIFLSRPPDTYMLCELLPTLQFEKLNSHQLRLEDRDKSFVEMSDSTVARKGSKRILVSVGSCVWFFVFLSSIH